jgi:hypothetical protein
MADNRKIIVEKGKAHDILARRSENALKEKRRAELKKIKYELLTLAKRVAELEEEAA